MTPAEAAERLGRAVLAAVEARQAALLAGAQAMRQAAHDTIGTAGGPEGTWAGLADDTLDTKARLGQRGRVSDPDTLYATGRLRESFQVDASDPDRPVMSSADPVAALHEHGTMHMPARPVLAPIAHQQAEGIAHSVGQAVADAFRRELGQ